MLLRQTLLYLPAQILGPALQFVASVVWTHWLGPEDYGVTAYLLALQEFGFIVTLSWWAQYVLRFPPAAAEGAPRAAFARSENAVLGYACLTQVGVVLAGLALMGRPLSGALAAAAVLYTLSRSLMSYLAERARAAERIGLYTLAQSASLGLGFPLAWAGVAFIAAAPETVLAGFAAGQCIAVLALWPRFGFALSLRAPDSAVIRAALVFALPLLLSGAVGWFSVNGIRVIVDEVAGAAAVGLLSVGWGLGHRAAAVAAMLVTAAAFPLAVRRLKEGTRADALAQLARNGTLLLAVLAPVTAGVMMISAPLTDLLIAAPYRDATKAMLPIAMAAGALRNFRVHFPDQALILFERTKLTLWVNGAEAASAVLFTLVGLRLGGITGAGLGCAAGIGVGAVVCFSMAVIGFGLRPQIADGACILAAALAMALALAVFDWTRLGALGGLIAEIAAGALLYGAALLCLFPRRALAGAAALAR